MALFSWTAAAATCSFTSRPSTGLSALSEGDKLTFDILSNKGKEAAENLRMM
jgi:cold shock CspA family protein